MCITYYRVSRASCWISLVQPFSLQRTFEIHSESFNFLIRQDFISALLIKQLHNCLKSLTSSPFTYLTAPLGICSHFKFHFTIAIKLVQISLSKLQVFFLCIILDHMCRDVCIDLGSFQKKIATFVL